MVPFCARHAPDLAGESASSLSDQGTRQAQKDATFPSLIPFIWMCPCALAPAATQSYTVLYGMLRVSSESV